MTKEQEHIEIGHYLDFIIKHIEAYKRSGKIPLSSFVEETFLLETTLMEYMGVY